MHVRECRPRHSLALGRAHVTLLAVALIALRPIALLAAVTPIPPRDTGVTCGGTGVLRVSGPAWRLVAPTATIGLGGSVAPASAISAASRC